MFKKLYVLPVATVLMPLAASAIEVETTAGCLGENLGTEATLTATELVVRGTVDVTDLVYIDEQMGQLESLDLSGATIVDYSGARVLGLTSHPAATIPARSFVGNSLTSIVLPSNVEAIGDAAFAGSSIKSITLPATITSMGVGCFSNCTALESATISTANLGESTFADCTSLQSVTFTANTAVGEGCFSGCTALATITGSELATTIGARSFFNCSSLEAFTFGSSLQTIGDEAFAQSGVKIVDLQPCTALTAVGSYSFAFMPAVTDINLGAVPSLGEGVVMNCPNLVNFVFSSAATAVPDYAYSGNAAMDTTYMFNSNVTSIGRYAMSGMSQISTVTLPATTEEIGDNAMERLSGLKSITLRADAVPTLGSNVWAEVEQSLVTLYVNKEQVSNFEAAEQWTEFEIVGMTSGVEDAVVADSAVRGRVADGILYVESTGKELAAVRVYAANGQLLAAAQASGLEAQVTVGQLPAQALVAAVMLADGSVATLKIANN